MKATLLKYGPAAFLSMLILFGLGLLVGQQLDYSAQEIVGYLTMILSLSLVYFAIRHFRDRENNGQLSFGRGMAIGMIISACAGLGIAIADAFYTTVINPNFVTEFTDRELSRLKAELPAEEYDAAAAALMEQIDMMGSPLALAVLMFVTVLLLGLMISLISSLILRNTHKQVPA